MTAADDRPTLIAQVAALRAVRDRLTTDLIRLGADPEWVARRAIADTWTPHPDHSWAPDTKPGCGWLLGSLPCDNDKPHKGQGLGCTHVGLCCDDGHTASEKAATA